MNMDKRGWTTVKVTVSPVCKELPKGGVYNRLEKHLIHRKEPWNDVIERLLDFFEMNGGKNNNG